MRMNQKTGKKNELKRMWFDHYVLSALVRLGRPLPDDLYLRIMYRYIMKRRLDLTNPRNFSEKLQWLKLYYRNPKYADLADKYAARKYITEKIGKEYLVPLVGGPYRCVEEIDFERLPQSFVLKATNDSGGIVICKDKRDLDRKAAVRKLRKSMSRNFFYVGREWVYKDITPQIVAEKYMEEEEGKGLKDYKIYNFNGKPRMIEVHYNRYTDHKANLYTTDWKYIKAAVGYSTDSSHLIEKPCCLDRMLELAAVLSEDMPCVRTDFYLVGGRIYIGELTFYPWSGFIRCAPGRLDEIMGTWLKLPGKWKKIANEKERSGKKQSKEKQKNSSAGQSKANDSGR